MDIFIISPYTDPNPFVVRERVYQANLYVAELTKKGKICYSSISAMHHLIDEYDIPGTWEFWKKSCETMMSHADEVHVLCLPGWEESEGVQAEIVIAKGFNKKITFVKKTGVK